MQKFICAALVIAALPACKPLDPRMLDRGQSFKLTPDELSDIRQSVIWYLNRSQYIYTTDSDSIQFGKVAAAKNAFQNEHKFATLCGFIRVKQPGGTYSDEKLFMGSLVSYPARLHNDRVSVQFVSNGEEGKAFILAKCRESGVEL